jgi:hypothetical protein
VISPDSIRVEFPKHEFTDKSGTAIITTGSVPIRVEKACGVSSDVIASRIGFQRCPYSHDLEVA